MSSGFVAAGTNPEAPHPDTADSAWAAARATVSGIAQPPAATSEPEDSRSLYEILQANKAKKQEDFEEKLKFKNQFKALDEDDVEYLDSIMETEKRAEMIRKRELQAQLDEFRRLQSEGDRPTGAAADDPVAAEEAEFGTWKKRKRKEGSAKEAAKAGLGLKMRRISSGAKPVAAAAAAQQTEKPKGSESPAAVTPNKDTVEDKKEEEEKPEPPAAPAPAPAPAPVKLASLVDYGSDSDDG